MRTITLTTQTLAVIKAVKSCRGEGISGAEISKATGLASGSLYPILMRLEKAGWLASEWEDADPSEMGRPRRRQYRVTEFGQKSLNSIRDALDP
jgi:DNA-binding PadR family transcriptional regulator